MGPGGKPPGPFSFYVAHPSLNRSLSVGLEAQCERSVALLRGDLDAVCSHWLEVN
jgi:hypothetical protein